MTKKANRKTGIRHKRTTKHIETERYAPSVLDTAAALERDEPDQEHDDNGEDGIYVYTVKPGENIRLDRFLAERSDGVYSREYLKELILSGLVLVDGRPAKPARALDVGQVVELTVPDPVAIETLPEDIPLKVYYEDEYLLVVFKPRGMLTHPVGHFHTGTLVNALLHYCGDSLSGISGSIRPGIVHRLDRVTSGLLVVAKTTAAHHGMQNLFRTRQIDKKYMALVKGTPANNRGLVDAPIGRNHADRNSFKVDFDGRPSQTSYQLIKSYGQFSLVKLLLHTGRTHQIRVHMKFIGHPVIGDTMYGSAGEKRIPDGVALHAWSIAFKHPILGTDIKCIAPIPRDMVDLIREEHFVQRAKGIR
jgi:23S rRNA pseudouridine1911/1915/1917 synthase